MDDAAEVKLLGRHQRKSFREVESHLMTKYAAGSRAGAVGFVDAVVEYVLNQVKV